MSNRGMFNPDFTEILQERARKRAEATPKFNAQLNQSLIEVHDRMSEMEYQKELKAINADYS